MFDSDSSKDSNWGIVIFFLILFWVFTGGFGNRNGGSLWGNNETTPKDTCGDLADIKCTIGRDTAVLQGQLDTAFRTVINNDNVNTATILSGQQALYIKQLERENTQLFVTAQNDQTRTQMLLMNAEQNRRLDSIECNMLKRPPVYPSVCVPCSQNSCCA